MKTAVVSEISTPKLSQSNYFYSCLKPIYCCFLCLCDNWTLRTTSRKTAGLGTLSCLMKIVSKKHQHDASSFSYYPDWSNEEFNEGSGEKKNGAVFQNLCTPYPALNFPWLKEVIFVGARIQEVLNNEVLAKLFTLNQLRAWKELKSVIFFYFRACLCKPANRFDM